MAASLLKSYFRSLPEGLFLKSLFPDFERWRETGQILMSLFTKFYLKFSQFKIMVGKEVTEFIYFPVGRVYNNVCSQNRVLSVITLHYLLSNLILIQAIFYYQS